MSETIKKDEFSKNFTRIPNVLIRDPSLSAYAKVVYIFIRSYSPSFPSYSCILKLTGIGSRSTISKALNELKAKRFIRILDSPNHKSNLYEFIPPRPVDCPSPSDVLPLVHDLDTNKTKVIIPNNNAIKPPTDEPVEDFKREQIFAEASSSLGTLRKLNFKKKDAPTFNILKPG